MTFWSSNHRSNDTDDIDIYSPHVVKCFRGNEASFPSLLTHLSLDDIHALTMMTGKEEEAFVPARQQERQSKAFDPFLTTTAARMETSTTSTTRLGVFAGTTLRDDEKKNDSDEEMRRQRERRSSGSDNNHLVISLEQIENLDCAHNEKVLVTARVSDRFGNLKGKRCMFSSRKRAENSNTNIESSSSSNRKKDATTVNNNTNNAIEWGGETRDLLCRVGLRRDDRLVVEASVSNEGTFSGGLSKMMGGGASGKEKDKSCTQRVIGYGTCGLCCDRLEEEEGNGGGFGDGGFDDDDDNFPSDSKTSVTLIVPLRIGLSNTKNASRKCQAVVRVLFDVVPAMKKRIYLFRHGESAWNEAQRNVNVRNMMAYDHPLTEAGVAQCVRTAVLAKKPPTPTISTISSSSGNDDWEEVYANTYHVIVSPLTRAVQTAMILLAKHPATIKRNADVQKRNAAVKMASSSSSFATATTHSDLPPLIDIEGMNISGSPSVKTQTRREREEEDAQMWPRVDFRFSRACREIKSVGGLDSVGIECGGTRIFKRASEKLNLLNLAETQTIVDIFSERKCAEYFDVDSRDVRDKWWTAGDESDTSSSLVNERTKEFWEELKNSSHSSVSVVSHSDFIRKLLRQTTDDACNTRSAKETLKKVREHKICNAGCIGLDVMFNPRTGNIEVLECELLFGTTFQD